MSKELIWKALDDDELRRQLLEEFEVEELEDRVAPRPMCFMPISG
jgi:hypothetical protein